MTAKSPGKKRARQLQERTGWSYSECLRCARTLTDEQIEALIQVRSGNKQSPERRVEVQVFRREVE